MIWNLAELHFQVAWVAAVVEERLFISFNDPPFDVVVRSWWKLWVNEENHSRIKCYYYKTLYDNCKIAGFVGWRQWKFAFYELESLQHFIITPKKIVVLLYLSDVYDFMQLHKEPLDGIVNLPKFLLGDTDPCRHWDKTIKTTNTDATWLKLHKHSSRIL